MDFGAVQARSRAVLAQEPENLQLCPDQAWESQSCTGESCTSSTTVLRFRRIHFREVRNVFMSRMVER